MSRCRSGRSTRAWMPGLSGHRDHAPLRQATSEVATLHDANLLAADVHQWSSCYQQEREHG